MSIGAPYRHDTDNTSFLTPAGPSVTLTMEDADEIFIDANGTALKVVLPPDAMGAKVTIINVGGEIISVLDPGVTVVNEAIATLEVGTFYCDGTVWHGATAVHGA